MISQAELTAGDTDGNGTIRLLSAVTGEAGLDLVTFFITIDNVVDCNASVESSIGCWNATGLGDNANFDLGQHIASEVFTISENPSGLIVFVSSGECDGSGIFDGYECSGGMNDYIAVFSIDPVFEAGEFGGCGDPASNPLLGPCNEANPGVGGCEDPDCCKTVCGPGGFNVLCCSDVPLGWIIQCAEAAVDLGCAPEPGGPICIYTNNADQTTDNDLVVCTDPYGSWTADGFGGDMAVDPEWGDNYNPVGAEDTAEASFSNGFFLFDAKNSQRELLSNILDWQDAFTPDATLERTILGDGSLFFDDDLDGLNDRLESSFVVTGAGKDLLFDLTQTIGQIIGAPGGDVAVLTQVYVVTNNSGAATSFEMVRHLDLDLVWNGSTFSDDSVGSSVTGNPALGLYAFQGEQGADSGTYVTVATDITGGQYYCSKSGIQPPGGGPTNGAGTDTQQWDTYGVPPGWGNYIPGLGYDLDGESGPLPVGGAGGGSGGPGADGSIGISIPVNLAGAGPSSTATITVTTTYGANSPLGALPPGGGGGSCLWDCQVVEDGNVGINDFLDLLGQWSQVGSLCDFNEGPPGVGVEDFLALLGHWGPCP